MLDRLVRTGAVTALALAAPLALAQTKLDVSMPWGPSEFHVVNAQNFAKRVGEVDHVLADRGLLRHPRRSRIAEAGRPVAAQIWHQRSVTCRNQRRHHSVERTDVGGKSVEENHRKPAGVSAVFVADPERGRVDEARGCGLRLALEGADGGRCQRTRRGTFQKLPPRVPHHCDEG